jgi:hypothetical protein
VGGLRGFVGWAGLGWAGSTGPGRGRATCTATSRRWVGRCGWWVGGAGRGGAGQSWAGLGSSGGRAGWLQWGRPMEGRHSLHQQHHTGGWLAGPGSLKWLAGTSPALRRHFAGRPAEPGGRLASRGGFVVGGWVARRWEVTRLWGVAQKCQASGQQVASPCLWVQA